MISQNVLRECAHYTKDVTSLPACCFKLYRARQKSNPLGKIYISEIVADIFTKFAEFTEEDSVHITCKFY